MIAGTVDYLSLEQALGRPLDRRTDLFSFGIVFFQMLTEEHPFEGASSTEKMANILTQPTRKWPADVKVPSGLLHIVEKALEKDVETRYANAADVLRDLEGVRRDLDSGRAFEPRFSSVLTREDLRAFAPGRMRVVLGVAVGLAALAVVLLLVPRSPVKRDSLRGVLEPVQVTTSASLDVYPSFSPDSHVLAYASDKSGAFEIYARQLTAGGSEIAITKDGGQNLQPAWSPDGQSIAYVSRTTSGRAPRSGG